MAREDGQMAQLDDRPRQGGLDRILILSNRYPPYYKGGYSLSCRLVADELAQRGYKVHVLTSNWLPSREQLVMSSVELVEDNVHRRLHIRERPSRHPLRQRWQHLKWAVAARLDYQITHQLMQDLSPDIVYIWNMSHLALSPLDAVQDLGLPFVLDVGDYWLLQRYQELYTEPDSQRQRYRLFVHGLKSFNPLQFSHILANSCTLKQRYVKSGFPAEQITVIPRSVPAHFVRESPARVPKHPSVKLLFAGRVTEAKGVHLAIQTVALLNGEMFTELSQFVRLDIVGDGEESYVQSLREQVASLGLAQAVHFLGRLAQEELIERYPYYDIVLIPAVWFEPFGRSALEAMAQGVCVIASDRGGPAEQITHGQNGLLVPPEDPRAMAQAVISLIRDEAQRDRIRRAAIATVRENYTLESVVERVEAYLQAALAQRRLA